MNDARTQETQAWMNQEPMILGGRYGHGMAKIDEHRIIIVGGVDADGNILSSCFFYDVRTQQSTALLTDLPAALTGCCVVANEEYVYVLGGHGRRGPVNTVYRLCLKSEKWTTLAPMGTGRYFFAAALKDKYIYVFGGVGLSSTERYSIDNNTWGYLPIMPEGPRFSHCAISTTGSEIYIVGGHTCSVDVFDTAMLTWRYPKYLRHIPEETYYAAAVVLKNKYLVVIGGRDEDNSVTASCLIYDIWYNHWSTTLVSMEMIKARSYHTAAVLDGKIVVAGGQDQYRKALASVECIDADALLEYAPLHYPLPTLLFNRILEIGKFKLDRVD